MSYGYDDRGGNSAWDKGKYNDEMYDHEGELSVDRSNRGCWSSFAGCVGGMWATRQLTKKEDREVYVRTTLRELIVYIIFLAVLCVLTFGMASPSMYYYTRVLNDLFLDTPYPDTRNTLRGSTQVLDFWRFVDYVMIENLYWDFWYDVGKTPIPIEDRNILYENRLLGIPRLRQLRVKNDSCTVPPDFKKSIIKCYNTYSPKHEDTRPFGIGDVFHYKTEEELDGFGHWGKLDYYSGAGHVLELSAKKDESKKIMDFARRKLFIDRGTRVIFLDFTVYNANLNLFSVVKIVVEFPATGGIIPSWSFKTIKLLRYVTVYDHIVLACEIVFALFIIYYIIEEVLEIMTLKCRYFRSLWNILDLVVIGLSIVGIAFSIYNTLTIGDTLERLLKDQNEYANFEKIGFWMVQYNALVAICVFCAWFKLFKYISFNKTMTQLFSTLSRSANDVAGFAVIFFIVFFAFAQLGYLLFGTQVRDFSSFIYAVFTLLRTILGDFNFTEIEQAQRVLGPIYFLSYVFFVFFVLLNMFLAIINDTYSEVKSEISNQKNEFELQDYFKRGYNNMLGKIGKRDKIIDIENALKLSDSNHDNALSYEEVRRNLKKCNFSDLEIEVFFSNYDVDGSRLLEHDEIKAMLNDLNGKRMENDGSAPRPPPRPSSSRVRSRPGTASTAAVAGVSEEELGVVTHRLDEMEKAVGVIGDQIDEVIYNLKNMERSKASKKDAINKRMDHFYED